MNPSITGEGAPAQTDPGSAQGDLASNGTSSINSDEQARRVQAFEDALQEFRSMPDNDPPGAWEEAMRDLDAHRPHRKLFDGIV